MAPVELMSVVCNLLAQQVERNCVDIFCVCVFPVVHVLTSG